MCLLLYSGGAIYQFFLWLCLDLDSLIEVLSTLPGYYRTYLYSLLVLKSFIFYIQISKPHGDYSFYKLWIKFYLLPNGYPIGITAFIKNVFLFPSYMLSYLLYMNYPYVHGCISYISVLFFRVPVPYNFNYWDLIACFTPGWVSVFPHCYYFFRDCCSCSCMVFPSPLKRNFRINLSFSREKKTCWHIFN